MIFGEYLMFFVKNLFICKENRNLFCAIFVAFYSTFYYRISRFFCFFYVCTCSFFLLFLSIGLFLRFLLCFFVYAVNKWCLQRNDTAFMGKSQALCGVMLKKSL